VTTPITPSNKSSPFHNSFDSPRRKQRCITVPSVLRPDTMKSTVTSTVASTATALEQDTCRSNVRSSWMPQSSPSHQPPLNRPDQPLLPRTSAAATPISTESSLVTSLATHMTTVISMTTILKMIPIVMITARKRNTTWTPKRFESGDFEHKKGVMLQFYLLQTMTVSFLLITPTRSLPTHLI